MSFPVSLLMKSVPQLAGSVPPPDSANNASYGEYLVTLAGLRRVPQRFAQYKEYLREGAPQCSGASFTVMPWLSFAQLAAQDLRAMYAFLRAPPAVSNAVETHTPEPAASR